ncbi:hypothetical protein K439DRAFT_1618399 [Ramaria rubella]|nr:hypothetical protein K439DRAFT_1618399 [Ramaria rubella]
MDRQQAQQSPQNPPYSHPHPLFPSSTQLPPPSHLHLPPPHSSSFRSNTLPPLSPLAAAGSSRFPPASYHPSLSSPYSSSTTANQNPWPQHRTSSAREDVKPVLHPHSSPNDISKGKGPDRDMPPPPSRDRSYLDHPPPKDVDDGMPPTSDFVKKLYKMLQDNTYSDVVCWGSGGDCFIIKDMTEFTKSILPRMFKHSNFASFVRQLNKYDFHKVKNNEENTFGDHSWTFRHPDFQADRREALENIKRKVPSQRKSANTKASVAPSNSTGPPTLTASPSSPASPPDSNIIQSMQSQIDRLSRTVEEMSTHFRSLEHNYQSVLGEMVNFQRNMAQQDGLMQNLIQYFLQLENGRVEPTCHLPDDGADSVDWTPLSLPFPGKQKEDQSVQLPPTENQFVPASEAQRIIGGAYPETDVARASFEQMNEISRRANTAGMQFTGAATPPLSGSPVPGRSGSPLTRQDALQRIEELQRARPTSAQGRDEAQNQSSSPSQEQQQQQQSPTFPSIPDGLSNLSGGSLNGNANGDVPFPGLQVFTVGHLLPRSSAALDDGTWSFDPSTLQLPAPPAVTQSATSYAGLTAGPSKSNGVARRVPTPQRLRVRRSTFVPGWAVPPRVLLVDDDAVSRKLSSKFLQVFGCTIDVAVDGVGAVNKMNLEKYDLVLMDIVMPKLDGVSATSLIRQFDPMTPIISMTSNSKPNEILTYYSHGMNDILPKPFTKEGLLDMLEKHLMHLKVIQEMAKVPRGPGIPPLNDAAFNEALIVGSSNNPSTVASSSTNTQSPLPLPPMSEDDARINPLAGLGLSDEQYAQILQTIVHGDTFSGIDDTVGGAGVGAGGLGKRALDDPDQDPRDEKRSRFQVVE